MKTKIISMMLMAMFLFVACEEEEPNSFCENPEAVCPDDTEIEANACCTSTSCYWTYKGVDKPCDGKDCADVRNEIITDACLAGVNMKSWNGDLDALDAELKAVTDKLLEEARVSCADCN
ncbi:hypothetical protein [Labilibacter marinus]|uniref:hypothetical protein n=1 Tax=Labilibacter marinus TaxID=1477105 RepID=UPI000831A3F7|nr:hypothetical protein [Labilibacter marinus]